MIRTASVMILATLTVACLATNSSADFLIDFNSTNQDGGPHNQEGYQSYEAGHEVAEDFTTQSFSAFGTTVSLTPTWPSTTDKRVQQMIDRGAGFDGNYVGTKLDLVTDFIGIDTRTGNGGNGDGTPTTMAFTIEGLPAGEYNYLSYQHDTEHANSIFSIDVDDAVGPQTIGIFEMTASSEGGNLNDNPANPGDGIDPSTLSSTVDFGITSDGINPIVITYTTTGASPPDEINVHNQIFGVNGIEISAVPEPSTLALLTVGLLAGLVMVRRRKA